MVGSYTREQIITFTGSKEVMDHINTQRCQWGELIIQKECGAEF